MVHIDEVLSQFMRQLVAVVVDGVESFGFFRRDRGIA